MTAAEIREKFRARFGAEPQVVGVAPGRVNLIGEHTDYNDGFVFPAAIDRVTYVAAASAGDATDLFSAQTGPAGPFDAGTVEPAGAPDWGKYPAGMAWAMRRGGADLPNLRGYVSSDIPIGSGVSSSAALEMAFGVVWNELARLALPNPELAKLGQLCENGFIGVNSGIMDQMASAMGRDGHAMSLDTRSLEIEYAPLPDSLRVVVLDTKTPRALTSSAYNERRTQCETAARILGVPKLRDANSSMLQEGRDRMDPIVYRRARHVTSENERCREFLRALRSGDLGRLGPLMRASHESLRGDYEVSSPELDAMAQAAWVAPGVVGARMTGAGFGGACVALAESGRVDEFASATMAGYRERTGREGEAMVCRVVDGARLA